MQRFLEEIHKSDFKNFKVIKINKRDIENIMHSTMRSLQLGSINELRDKFEGMVFYRNFERKISGIIALEKVLKTPLIDWKLINAIEYEPIVEINGRKVNVFVSDFGELPLLDFKPENPVILFIRKEELILWLVGLQDPIILKEVPKGHIYGKAYQVVSIANFSPFSDYKSLCKLLD